MAEEDKDDFRAKESAARDERRAKESAARDERRAKESSARDEKRAKEAESRARTQGKTPKGTSERKAAREEAKSYDIDTKGMSTREIKGAISEAKAVEQDMVKFIEKSLNNFSAKKDDVSPADIPASTTSRITEDKPAALTPVSGFPLLRRGGGGGTELPPAPTSGVWVLASENGELRWLQTQAC
jgi:hypothetical protein